MDWILENIVPLLVFAFSALGATGGLIWAIAYKFGKQDTEIAKQGEELKDHGEEINEIHDLIEEFHGKCSGVETELRNVVTLKMLRDHCAQSQEKCTGNVCKKIDKLEAISMSIEGRLTARMDKMDAMREDSKKEQSLKDERLFTLLGRLEQHIEKG